MSRVLISALLTYLSCQSRNIGELVEGLSYNERVNFEKMNPSSRFAYDGMRLKLSDLSL
jgi:hypothetical protein